MLTARHSDGYGSAVFFSEARTLDVAFTQPRGTPREKALRAFLVILADDDESPAHIQWEARVETHTREQVGSRGRTRIWSWRPTKRH